MTFSQRLQLPLDSPIFEPVLVRMTVNSKDREPVYAVPVQSFQM